MNNIELIRWMVQKQDSLNAVTNAGAVEKLAAESAVSNPTWKNLRRKWHRAIWMEAAEMLERTPYKWWKAAPALDPMQMKIELVDVFHFLLSWMIQDGFSHEGIQVAFDRARIEPVMDQELAIERLAHAASGGPQNFANTRDAFAVCCVAFDLDIPEIHRLYAGKNLLNLFRQGNGYKEGSYRKLWSDGREDNEHLAEVIAASGDVEDAEGFAQKLLSGLAARYAVGSSPEAA